MAVNVKLKDEYGQYRTYSNIESLTVPTDVDGTTATFYLDSSTPTPHPSAQWTELKGIASNHPGNCIRCEWTDADSGYTWEVISFWIDGIGTWFFTEDTCYKIGDSDLYFSNLKKLGSKIYCYGTGSTYWYTGSLGTPTYDNYIIDIETHELTKIYEVASGYQQTSFMFSSSDEKYAVFGYQSSPYLYYIRVYNIEDASITEVTTTGSWYYNTYMNYEHIYLFYYYGNSWTYYPHIIDLDDPINFITAPNTINLYGNGSFKATNKIAILGTSSYSYNGNYWYIVDLEHKQFFGYPLNRYVLTSSSYCCTIGNYILFSNYAYSYNYSYSTLGLWLIDTSTNPLTITKLKSTYGSYVSSSSDWKQNCLLQLDNKIYFTSYYSYNSSYSQYQDNGLYIIDLSSKSLEVLSSANTKNYQYLKILQCGEDGLALYQNGNYTYQRPQFYSFDSDSLIELSSYDCYSCIKMVWYNHNLYYWNSSQASTSTTYWSGIGHYNTQTQIAPDILNLTTDFSSGLCCRYSSIIENTNYLFIYEANATYTSTKPTSQVQYGYGVIAINKNDGSYLTCEPYTDFGGYSYYGTAYRICNFYDNCLLFMPYQYNNASCNIVAFDPVNNFHKLNYTMSSGSSYGFNNYVVGTKVLFTWYTYPLSYDTQTGEYAQIYSQTLSYLHGYKDDYDNYYIFVNNTTIYKYDATNNTITSFATSITPAQCAYILEEIPNEADPHTGLIICSKTGTDYGSATEQKGLAYLDCVNQTAVIITNSTSVYWKSMLREYTSSGIYFYPTVEERPYREYFLAYTNPTTITRTHTGV